MLAGEAQDCKYEIAGVKYCIYSKRFWQYLVLLVFGVGFGAFFGFSYKVFGMDTHKHAPIQDKTLTLAASIGGGLVNGASRFTMGAL